jgi:hypothetical protein
MGGKEKETEGKEGWKERTGVCEGRRGRATSPSEPKSCIRA